MTTDVFGDWKLTENLTDDQRALLASAATEVSLPAGAVVFEEGQPADGCWLIRSGRIALETPVPGRGAIVIQTLGAGDVLGWSWLVPPRQWHFSARVVEAVTATHLDTTSIRALAEADPALGYPLALGLFEAVLERLQSTRARLLDLYRSPRDR